MMPNLSLLNPRSDNFSRLSSLDGLPHNMLESDMELEAA